MLLWCAAVIGQDAGIRRSNLPSTPAGAPPSEEEAVELIKELSSLMRCPVCQGLSIADSPSPSALAMRDEVSELVRQGYSKEQILDYFEASYGEFVRLQPKARGFNLFVWLAPAAGALVGLGLIWRRLSVKPKLPEKDDEDLASYREKLRAQLEDEGERSTS